jgi:hypothetical protein
LIVLLVVGDPKHPTHECGYKRTDVQPYLEELTVSPMAVSPQAGFLQWRYDPRQGEEIRNQTFSYRAVGWEWVGPLVAKSTLTSGFPRRLYGDQVGGADLSDAAVYNQQGTAEADLVLVTRQEREEIGA